MNPNYTKNIADFDAVRLLIASPDDILSWSYGEVTKPETINYRTQKPERDGLFCEKIFGPVKDINPHDAKLKGVRARDAAVDRNGDLVTKAIVRRERMAHIKLATPIVHVWFMHGTPSVISALLGATVKKLEQVSYYQNYIILNVDEEARDQKLADNENIFEAGKAAIKMRYEKAAGDKDADVKALAADQTKELDKLTEDYEMRKQTLGEFVKGALISDTAYRNLDEEFEDLIEVGMGGEAIYKLLSEIDLDELIADLQVEADSRKGQARAKVQKRLRIVENLKKAGIAPESLCLTVLPVIPPDLRPMVQLTGGRFATSDLNDLYRRVINRNNRLKKLVDLKAPEVIQRNEKRILQEAVDALIDNSPTRGRQVTATGGRRALKSLSDLLKGKQGRFRQNLLGKRVDYSGRSVIVAGPELKIHQCGLPKQMALELFKPFIISKLLEWEEAHNIRSASRLIETGTNVIWDALDEVIKGKYVLLNRAPSLHRLSIQAFQPKLIEGQAIQLNPLVTTGFNADFDGDQMAVHLPLSDEAQAEARDLMSATNNILKPADGKPTLSIYQDIVLGCYYMTYDKPDAIQATERAFSSVDEAVLALDKNEIKLQTNIVIRYKGKNQHTNLGRVLFNEVLPTDFPFINETLTKKEINKVLANVFNKYGNEITAQTADAIKDLGLEHSTKSAISTGMDDYFEIDDLDLKIKLGNKKVEELEKYFADGLMTNRERHVAIRKVWDDLRKDVVDEFKQKLETTDTSISVSVSSGARGSIANIVDVSGLIGTVDATYNTSTKSNLEEARMRAEIELPIRSGYKTGLTALEFTNAARSSRKGLIDTALNTAKSGYLTRRLVDVAQDVFIVEGNDARDDGFTIFRSEEDYTKVSFADRIYGRYTAEEIKGYIKADELITREIADNIQNDENIDSVKIQSVLSTTQLGGIPQKAYGIDMSTGYLVAEAEPVGVIAAQSVGEPATQLTLNTRHGVEGESVTEGLPRLEELLELYGADVKDGKLKLATGASREFYERKYAVLSELDGKALVKEDKKTGKTKITITGKVVIDNNEYEKVETYTTRNRLLIKNGEKVVRGQQLTAGSIYPPYLMELSGIEAAQRYILNEILRLYASQGYNIATKHIEIIVRQMFSRVEVTEAGDSEYTTGALLSTETALATNAELKKAGKKPLEFIQRLEGIKRVSSTSDSFLSAASFQDTTRVLINSAIAGKVDKLKGLKENVIIGRKIPVGTGAIDEREFYLNQTPSEDEFADV